MDTVNAGTLIILEGIDGSGKSTQAARLVTALRGKGHEVLATGEPTSDGHFGRRIRAMAASGERIEPREELRWFMEDRRAHVEELIRPALARGAVIVCDRYFLSTVAYQGARGLDWLKILAESEATFPLPDLALLVEVDPATGLERVAGRPGHSEPAFEDAGFLERVAEIFAALERPYLERIDGRASPAVVEAAIREAVSRRLGLL